MDTPTRPRADLSSINLLKGSIRNSIRKNQVDRGSNKENEDGSQLAQKASHHHSDTAKMTVASPVFVSSNSPSARATFDSSGTRILQNGRPSSSPSKSPKKPTMTANSSDSSFSMPSPQIAHLSPKFTKNSDDWTTPKITHTTKNFKRPPSTPLTPGGFQQNVRRVKLGTPATVSTCNLFYPPSQGLADGEDDDEEDTENHTAPFPSIPAFHIDTPVVQKKPLPSFNPNWDSPDCLSDSTPMGTPDTVLKMRQYITKLKSKPRFVSLGGEEDAGNVSLSNSSSLDTDFGPVSPVKTRKTASIDLAELESQLVTQRYDLEIEQMTDVLDFMKLEARLKV